MGISVVEAVAEVDRAEAETKACRKVLLLHLATGRASFRTGTEHFGFYFPA